MTSGDPLAPSRRERNKQKTRVALESAAWALFREKGYDVTTIDEISDKADVAARTFFRYFESKEAVLFGDWRESLDQLRQRIAARPADEAPIEALTQASIGFSDYLDADRDLFIARAALMPSQQTVGTYQRQIVLPTWEDTLTEAMEERLGVNQLADVRPRLFAAVAVAAINAAVIVWLGPHADAPLASYIKMAFVELG